MVAILSINLNIASINFNIYFTTFFLVRNGALNPHKTPPKKENNHFGVAFRSRSGESPQSPLQKIESVGGRVRNRLGIINIS